MVAVLGICGGCMLKPHICLKSIRIVGAFNVEVLDMAGIVGYIPCTFAMAACRTIIPGFVVEITSFRRIIWFVIDPLG